METTATRRWRWARRLLSALLIVVVAAFTWFYVQPFGPRGAEAPAEDQVAVDWDRTIGRLGITPVYPPEEDFFVGDVWAVISNARDKAPLLGKAVRLGHMDLRTDILAEGEGRPRFADTAELKKTDEFRHQEEVELEPSAPGKIRLTLAAFPGVTISHVVKAGSAAGTSLFGFGASRNDSLVEEIRIPSAETYGVGASRAAGRLMMWCEAPETKIFCTDAYVRRVLAYTIDPDVATKVDGAYPIRIELQLVLRVFLTRTIEQRRSVQTARGFAVGRGSSVTQPTAGGDAVSPEARARDAVSAVQEIGGGLANGAAPAMNSSNGDDADISLQQTFERPIVFGFRSLQWRLKPEDAK